MPDTPDGSPPSLDALTRHNLVMESWFSAFNGVFMGLAIIAAPVVAVVGVGASPLELTLLVCAFPVGAFLGPLWAGLGRRWGMKRLVTQMAVWANLPLLFMWEVRDPWAFTILITISQLLNSAMRMGQSSLYGRLYDRPMRGRVLGRLTFWTYVTMVPSVLLTGWLLNKSHEMYRILYPFAGLCGLIGCWYYHQLILPPHGHEDVAPPAGLRARFREVEQVFARDHGWLLLQVIFFLCGASFFLSTHVILVLVRDGFPFTPFELTLWISVVPQILLALTSPVWGRVLDRIGMARSRLLIGLLLAASLASYFAGIFTGTALLIVAGGVFLGIGNGGGQLTWALASSSCAPRPADVPLYNGIHFVFNGIRGLIMPWVGAVLLVLIGSWSILVALLVCLLSIPVNLRLMQLEQAKLNGQQSKVREQTSEDGNQKAGKKRRVFTQYTFRS